MALLLFPTPSVCLAQLYRPGVYRLVHRQRESQTNRVDMSGRAEGVRIGTTSLRLLPSDPSMVSLLPSKSEEDQKELQQQSLSVARNESVMSSRAPRIQNLSNGKASAAGKHPEPAAVTPVPTLDPVHRQKIIQLRLQAAKASMNRGRSFRRKLFYTFLLLAI